MKKIGILIAIFSLLACKNKNSESDGSSMIPAEESVTSSEEISETIDSASIAITPISHATAIIKWGETAFYTDPVGGAEAFKDKEAPDFILLTDIHGDHLNIETLKALKLGDTKLIVPQAVQEKLPEAFDDNLIVMNNGDSINFNDFSIKAIPMYNLPQTANAMHVKGRGNGYVLEKDGKRLYISGDTEDIPEMRNLTDIDVALVCMNLPYTMPVEQAAEGVLAFAPKKVYPYHYRGKDGLADVEKFKSLVNQKNKNIEVILLDWYPER